MVTNVPDRVLMMDHISLVNELKKQFFFKDNNNKIKLLFRFRFFFCLAALVATVVADVDPESPTFVL